VQDAETGKTCVQCKRLLPEDSFRRYPQSGNLRPRCKECERIRDRNGAARRRRKRKKPEFSPAPKIDLSSIYGPTIAPKRLRTNTKTVTREEVYLLVVRVLEKMQEEEEMRAAYLRKLQFESGISKEKKPPADCAP
jgi:hypothetical protein